MALQHQITGGVAAFTKVLWGLVSGSSTLAEAIESTDGAMHTTPVQSQLDPFGRQRVSVQESLWDLRHTADNTSNKAMGFGAGSDSFDAEHAARKLVIPANTAGTRTYAGHLHVPYQPGKGQHLKGTSIFGAMTTGVIRRHGLRNRRTGERMFWEQDGNRGGNYVVLESYRGAGLVRTVDLEEEFWGAALPAPASFEKNVLFDLDFQWLSSGRVRYGFDDGDGRPVYVHKEKHSGRIAYPFTRVPDFQVFWELTTTLNNLPEQTLYAVCASIEADGGQELTGRPYGITSALAGTAVAQTPSETVLLVVRAAALYKTLDNIGLAVAQAVSAAAGGEMLVRVVFNPTVTGGTFTAVGGDSCLEYANGDTGALPTITGGQEQARFFVTASGGNSIGVSVMQALAFVNALTRTADGAGAMALAVVASRVGSSAITDGRCSVQFLERAG